LRADLNAADVPIVIGTIAEFKPGREKINEVLRALPSQISKCGCAEAKDLKHKGDNLHLDAPSAREFGKRYAAEWLKLAKGAK
jgi:hypothetical protein